MKRLSSTLYLLWSMLAFTAPTSLLAQAGNFSITGHLTRVDAQWVTLIYYAGGKLRNDTAAVINHAYAFRGTIEGGQTAILKDGLPGDLLTANRMVLMYLSPETFGITHTDVFSDAGFTGSVVNEEFLKLRGKGRQVYQETESLRHRVANARIKGDSALADRLQDSLNDLNQRKADLVYGDYVRDNTTSPLQLYAFMKYYAAMRGAKDQSKLQSLLDLLPDSIQAMSRIKSIAQQIANNNTFNTAVTVGKMAPDFTMDDTLGQPVALSSFRGHYLLLDFWASWCGPCRAENPNVVREYGKYHSKGFDILGVSLDQPGAKDKWLKAIHADGLSWNHVSDLKFWNSEAVKIYGIQSIPLNFLIDPLGKIVARNLRGDDLDKALAAVYGN